MIERDSEERECDVTVAAGEREEGTIPPDDTHTSLLQHLSLLKRGRKRKREKEV